jgi:hypothetical protein
MTFPEAAFIWASGFANVFLLGFQSRNAVAGRYVRCACTSFLIAACQVVAVRAVMVGDPVLAALLIGSSGSAGICAAIFVNTRLAGLRKL